MRTLRGNDLLTYIIAIMNLNPCVGVAPTRTKGFSVSMFKILRTYSLDLGLWVFDFDEPKWDWCDLGKKNPRPYSQNPKSGEDFFIRSKPGLRFRPHEKIMGNAF